MNIGRIAAVSGLALVMGLGACTTLETARDRIVKRAPACPDQAVEIYFEPESSDVTPESRAVIAGAAQSTQACKVKSVEVLGLADAAGDPQANLALSERRAQSVAAALSAAGLPTAEFKVAAAGQAGALTANGQSRPLRRRVDVILHLSRP